MEINPADENQEVGSKKEALESFSRKCATEAESWKVLLERVELEVSWINQQQVLLEDSAQEYLLGKHRRHFALTPKGAFMDKEGKRIFLGKLSSSQRPRRTPPR